MPVIKNLARSYTKKVEAVSAWDSVDGVRLLLYGRSGTGKTTLWSSFPGPILALVCSGCNQPGELKSIDTPENRRKIDPRVISDSQQIRDILANSSKFATIVLDHASGLQDLVLKEILGLQELPVQRSWGMAQQQQWGQCTLQCKELLRAILNSCNNVVIVAQEREFNTDSVDGSISPSVGAGLTPSLTGWLNTAADYICQTFIRQREEERVNKIGGKEVKKLVKKSEVEYCIRTAPDPVYTTKFRLPKGRVLPSVIVDPSFEKINQLIK